MTSDADELVTRHQKVREFVELRFPERYVTDIDERARTRYWRGNKTEPSYILAYAESVFAVEAESRTRILPSIRCDIAMMRDGSFKVLQDRQFFVYP
jgi:hypothetical protein